MKKSIYILIAAVFAGTFASCSQDDYKVFDSSDAGIYYAVEEFSYSFGISATTVTSRVLEIPVLIMGATSDKERTFGVTVVDSLTNAVEGKHFELPSSFVIGAGSVEGIVPLEVLRGELGEEEWTVTLLLVANENFTPVEMLPIRLKVGFNNIVSKPNWKDWSGSAYWPTSQLGNWDPTIYVLFIEYFNKMAETAPSTYRNLVDLYGENLENINEGWPWDYDYSLKKYILTPMYDYLVANPQLGLSIPKPY